MRTVARTCGSSARPGGRPRNRVTRSTASSWSGQPSGASQRSCRRSVSSGGGSPASKAVPSTCACNPRGGHTSAEHSPSRSAARPADARSMRSIERRSVAVASVDSDSDALASSSAECYTPQRMARGLLALLCILVCLIPVKGWAAVCADGEPACCCCGDDGSEELPVARRVRCCEADGSTAPTTATAAVVATQGLDVAAVQADLAPVIDVPTTAGRRIDAGPCTRAPPSALRRLARLSHWLL
jgi:hypothetical protein